VSAFQQLTFNFAQTAFILKRKHLFSKIFITRFSQANGRQSADCFCLKEQE